MRFFRKSEKKGKKMFKKGKKVQNIWKCGQKCTTLENILKKGRWLRAIIAGNKLLEKALDLWISFKNFVCESLS